MPASHVFSIALHIILWTRPGRIVLVEIVCASFIPRPNAVICGVPMHTKLENGILCNGQQLWCAGRAWLKLKMLNHNDYSN